MEKNLLVYEVKMSKIIICRIVFPTNYVVPKLFSLEDSDALKLLQLKLRAAVDRIRALMQEKNMLLESSNKMRAELYRFKQVQESTASELSRC